MQPVVAHRVVVVDVLAVIVQVLKVVAVVPGLGVPQMLAVVPEVQAQTKPVAQHTTITQHQQLHMIIWAAVRIWAVAGPGRPDHKVQPMDTTAGSL